MRIEYPYQIQRRIQILLKQQALRIRTLELAVNNLDKASARFDLAQEASNLSRRQKNFSNQLPLESLQIKLKAFEVEKDLRFREFEKASDAVDKMNCELEDLKEQLLAYHQNKQNEHKLKDLDSNKCRINCNSIQNFDRAKLRHVRAH